MMTLNAQDPKCAARTGILNLPHGPLNTPAFMPVGTNGAVKAILHSTLEEMGYELILGNTYHLFLRPGTDLIQQYGGLHKFSSWRGNILTDSGGFQVFSLAPFRKIDDDGVDFRSHIDGSRHRLTPESVVDIQTLFGSDIQMQLDVCTPPGILESEARRAMNRTTLWAKRAKIHRAKKPKKYQGHLFGIVQGNFFRNLRRESAEGLVALDLPGYAIGGLSVGEEKEVFMDYLHSTAALLPDAKPKYIMGIGTPDYMLEAVEVGMDIFDCVYPTRVARNGTCFTFNGMLNLKNARFREDQGPIVDGCSCPGCQHYSRGYLRHLFMTKEITGPMLVTCHNLQFLQDMMHAVRTAIHSGHFPVFKKRFLERFESGHIE